MFKKAGVGVAVLVAALAIMAVGSSSAFAADTVACGLTGETGALTPPVKLNGGSGTFQFGGQAVCSINAGVPALSTLNASGTYNNTICGTGIADGTATLVSGSHTYSSIPFHIDFVGGVGKVVISAPASGNGVVHITPTQPGTDGSTCTSQFLVNGAFAGTI
jgi:hypothetical protein